MFVGGILSVYFDWSRRVILEAACEYEERSESKMKAKSAMVQDIFLRKPSINHESSH